MSDAGADRVAAFQHGYEMGWRDATKAARHAIGKLPLSPEPEPTSPPPGWCQLCGEVHGEQGAAR